MSDERQSRMRWFLIIWFFVLSAVAYLDRVNISIAGSSIAAEYHLSNVHLGYVFSSFLIGYAIFQTPGGRLADRLGPRRVIAIAVIWWGIFTALTASIPVGVFGALAIFIAVRFLLGAGEAIMYPASNQFVARWIPTEERGIANGWIFAGVGVGAGITPPLITHIMIHHGWRWSFWISAVIGIAVGAVWYIMARDSPETHPRVSPSELAHIKAGLTLTPSQGSAKPPQIPWANILRSKEVLSATLSYFTYGYAAWIFFSWFFIYLDKVRGLNLKSSAELAMMPLLAMAAGSVIGGVLSDRLTRARGKRAGRCVFSFVVMVLAGGFIAGGAFAQSAVEASLLLAAGIGSLYLSQSCFFSLSADISGPSSGSVTGFINMGGQIGGAVTASLTPLIAAHYGWTASFLVAAVLCALGGFAWLLINPKGILSSATRHPLIVQSGASAGDVNLVS
ncbi:MAG: MFS transporter [Acidobacteriota bacterium]|nr:MFS transporter [Acidobacteriota bacterium]